MAQRDPKTGRFLPKNQQTSVAPIATPKETPEFEIGKSVQTTLEKTLQIYMNKSLVGKPVNIRQGAAVIIQKLNDFNPSAGHVFRVKRQNCKRTYYTTEQVMNS